MPSPHNMSHTLTRTYPTGHRARIVQVVGTSYSLEVFTPEGERLLDFALMVPSIDLAKDTADFVVNGEAGLWTAEPTDAAVRQ
jgi:hypothetical protein